jgi:glyoxylase-like metal-dependent hydrolase (beta-lactamase superfamily II)
MDTSRRRYSRGLHELGDGLYAYLQPDGGWGWSNAGLIVAEGTSLLVDTLFDLKLTGQMLAEMSSVLERNPLAAAVNTHGNGDHCFGNQLLPSDVPIYATSAADEEIRAAPPEVLHALMTQTDLGPEFARFAREAFGQFTFEGMELRPPSATFDGSLSLQVGRRAVELTAVGPAHTDGDAIVYVPDAGVVFTGDIVFADGTPVMWAGPLSNWLAACDRVLELDARVIVPGHGPLTGQDGVRHLQQYLGYVRDEARLRFDAGMPADDAADDVDLGQFSDWGDAERIVVNVESLYREFDPSRPATPVPELFARMARWRARH